MLESLLILNIQRFRVKNSYFAGGKRTSIFSMLRYTFGSLDTGLETFSSMLHEDLLTNMRALVVIE